MALRASSRRPPRPPAAQETPPTPADQGTPEAVPAPPEAPAADGTAAAAPETPASPPAAREEPPPAPRMEGSGVEVLVTLGESIGCALYIDGLHVLDLGLGAHPVSKRRSYDAYVGEGARRKVGGKRWNRRVERAIGTLRTLLRPRVVYLAGPNARRVRGPLSDDIRVL